MLSCLLSDTIYAEEQKLISLLGLYTKAATLRLELFEEQEVNNVISVQLIYVHVHLLVMFTINNLKAIHRPGTKSVCYFVWVYLANLLPIYQALRINCHPPHKPHSVCPTIPSPLFNSAIPFTLLCKSHCKCVWQKKAAMGIRVRVQSDNNIDVGQ